MIGTIIKTLGQQLLRLGTNPVFTFLVDAGNFASESHVVGAAMAVGIGFAMKVPALVLFSLAAVGSAANVTGGAGGPLAVLIIAIVAAELGNLVSGKTKVDIIVTPAVTILVGALLTVLTAKYIGTVKITQLTITPVFSDLTAYVYDGYIEMQSPEGFNSSQYMTILVKFPKGTFETNSSSTHSMVIAAADDFEKWEKGELRPTWADLRNLARKYKRPSYFYFLSSPPKETVDFIEFRSDDKIEDFSPELRLEIRKAKSRRNAYIKIHEDMGLSFPNFGNKVSSEKNYIKLGKYIRNYLDVSFDPLKEKKKLLKINKINNRWY